MIDEETLMSFLHFFQDERQLEKDYLLNLMLKVVSVNKASESLEFKGGTSLYMFHGLDRFSEDLDFTYIGDANVVPERIDGLIDPVIKDFSLSYRVSKSKGNVVVRNSNRTVLGVRTEFFIEGPLFNRTRIRHRIKIDISARDDRIEAPEAARFVSKYADIGTVLLYKMPIEEALAEKVCAITERVKARDIYDAYFIMKFKGIKYDENMVKEKLGKRNERFDKGIILSNIRGFKESLWKEELSYLVKGLPALADVKSFMLGQIR